MDKKYWLRQIVVVAVIIAIAYVISAYFIQFALVRGDSMKPAYRNNQLVILNKCADSYNSGDVIAFKCPSLGSVLIKRVIAGPYDGVLISDGKLYVNGELFELQGVTNSEIEYAGIAGVELKLSADEYFVMGDNVNYSKDSRYEEIGCVKRADILGKVINNGR